MFSLISSFFDLFAATHLNKYRFSTCALAQMLNVVIFTILGYIQWQRRVMTFSVVKVAIYRRVFRDH